MKKKFILIMFSLTLFISIFSLYPVNVKADDYCSTYYLTGLNGQKYCVPQYVLDSNRLNEFKNVIATGHVSQRDYKMFEELAKSQNNGDYFTVMWRTMLNPAYGFKQSKGVLNCLFSGNYSNNECQLKSSFDSGYRNYYTNGSDGIYSSGLTKSYNIVNNKNNTVNYYNNNTFVSNTYNDYYYNVYNNTYNFNMIDNSVISVTYNIDNSVVNVIGSGNTVSYKYYFELPDGSNSLNMDPEKIKGFKLDFNVKNYDNVQDDNSLLGLYHFEGNKNNSAYSSDLNLTWTSDNYINDTSAHFESYLNFSVGNQNALLSLNNLDKIESIDLRFKPYLGKQFRLAFFNGTQMFFLADLEKTQQEVINYVDKETIGYTFFEVETNRQFASYKCSEKGGEYTGVYETRMVNRPNQMYATFCQCKKEVKTVTRVPIPSMQNVTKKDGFVDSINFSQWNHLAFLKNGSNVDVYLNGQFYKSFSFKSFVLVSRSDSFFGLDELRIAKKNVYVEGKNKHGNKIDVATTPYDSDLVYVLPETDNNNTILIQSRIPVFSTQFGGKRSSNPSKGDVYINVNDNNVITSLQQFNGVDWLLIKSSIYSEKEKKWVDLVGYSILNDDIVNPIVPSPSPGNPGGSGNDNNTNIFNPSSTNFWDFMIELIKTLPNFIDKIGETFIGLFGSFTDFVKWLFDKLLYLLIPSDEFFKNFEIPDFKTNLGILYTPFDLLGNFITTLFDFDKLNNSSFILEIDDIKLNNVVLINSFNFNVYDFVNKNESFKSLYETYLVVVDGVIYLALLNLIRLKVLSFLKR